MGGWRTAGSRGQVFGVDAVDGALEVGEFVKVEEGGHAVEAEGCEDYGDVDVEMHGYGCVIPRGNRMVKRKIRMVVAKFSGHKKEAGTALGTSPFYGQPRTFSVSFLHGRALPCGKFRLCALAEGLRCICRLEMVCMQADVGTWDEAIIEHVICSTPDIQQTPDQSAEHPIPILDESPISMDNGQRSRLILP